jgi:hypothetical protein
MTRLVRRFVAPASSILLGLLAGCASNNPQGPSSGTTAAAGGGGGGTAGTSASGTKSGSGTPGGGSGAAGTGASSGTGSSGGTTQMDAGTQVDAAAFCRVPTIDAGSLPFVVDTAYVPSGWMGDAPQYAAIPEDPATGAAAVAATTARMTLAPTMYGQIGDACSADKDSYGVTVGRSSANAKGACWKVVFVPYPKTVQPGSTAGTTKIGGGPGYGWAGAFWQYPKNNWGTVGGGYPIPPGANRVSFWARGKDGGEKVRFFSGEGLNIPCSDYVATANTNTTFPTVPAWTHYTVDITMLDYSTSDITPGQGPGGYYGGVIGAFGFGVGDQTLPMLDGGSAPPNETDPNAGPVADPAVPGMTFPPFFDSTVTIYIDDIEFQISDAGM